LKKKRVLVFGPSSSIGIEIVKELSARQADIVVATFDPEVSKEIINTSFFESNIHIELVDFTRLHSVANFCDNLLNENKTLDAFIGISEIRDHPPEISEDQVDITFQTNYLCHYLALIKLLTLLRKSRDGRVILLTSDEHKLVDRCPKKEFHRYYKDTTEMRSQAFQYSKFCLTSFAWKLADLANAPNLSVHCVNPGKYSTNPLHQIFYKTPNEAIQGILMAIMMEKPKPGFYIEGVQESFNYNRLAANSLIANILWSLSRKMCEKSHLTSS
jgi:NAD(P)-dependent dehydrogenase (short-subunit alcohol dehydrogenase family)